MKLTPTRKKHLMEIGYSVLLLSIFAMGYLTGYNGGKKGDPMNWSRYMIAIILIIKLIATWLTINTVSDDHPKT